MMKKNNENKQTFSYEEFIKKIKNMKESLLNKVNNNVNNNDNKNN